MPPFSAFLILGPANANLSFLFGVGLRAVDRKSARQREEGILQMMAKSDKKRRRSLLHLWLKRSSYFFFALALEFQSGGRGPFLPKWRNKRFRIREIGGESTMAFIVSPASINRYKSGGCPFSLSASLISGNQLYFLAFFAAGAFSALIV